MNDFRDNIFESRIGEYSKNAYKPKKSKMLTNPVFMWVLRLLQKIVLSLLDNTPVRLTGNTERQADWRCYTRFGR